VWIPLSWVFCRTSDLDLVCTVLPVGTYPPLGPGLGGIADKAERETLAGSTNTSAVASDDLFSSVSAIFCFKSSSISSETNYTCKLTVLRAKPRVIIAHKLIYIITPSI
jgi:hypothetical protein